MRRFPLATLVAVLSLAAGIGATASALGIRNAIFRNPPPLYRDPGQLSRLRVVNRRVPAALYQQWRATLGTTAGAATASGTQSDIRTSDRTATVPVRGVTDGLFSLLGVNAEAGSTTPGDSGALSVVLSYGVWEQLFDKRIDAIGRTIWIDNQPHTIVAVMPQRFWLTDMISPIWKPLDLRAVAPEEPLDVIVRRPSGVSPEILEAQLKSAVDSYAASLPPDRRRIRLRVAGIEGTPIGEQVALVLPYVLGVCVLLTLLIACANAATLMIAQWTTREHEIAIRAAIGAGRGRIIRSLLTESVIVAACGGALGVGAIYAMRAWMIVRSFGQARFFDLSIPPSLVAQVAAVTLAAGLLAGIMPALFETRRLQANPLKAMAGADRVRQRWRNVLVVLEVAVTIALLVVTSAMIDGYRRVMSADLGFTTRPLIGASLRHRNGINVDTMIARLERLPGVSSAAASTGVPYISFGSEAAVASDGRGSNGFGARQGAISPSFFSTLGVRMRAGRAFTTHDAPSARLVIVNESLANRMFPDGAAVGQTLWVDKTSYDIVGVVANYTTNMFGIEHVGAQLFVPLARDTNDPAVMNFLIRAEGDAGPLIEDLRRAIRGADADVEVRRLFSLAQIRVIGGQEILVGTAPLIPLIGIGLLLTTAGIYGVLAFAISRRARELAVRLAIGATNRHVISLVAGQAVRLVGIGAIIGVGLTFALSRVVRAGGGAGSLWDPPFVAFVVPAVILAATGIVAAWIPSRRALKIDPAIVLRTT
jgi:predicted permease